jgi:hypothetical protein
MNTEQPLNADIDQPVITDPAQPRKSKRSVTLKVAAILLVLLVVVGSGLAIARNYGLFGLQANRGVIMNGRPANGFQGVQNGQRPGNLPDFQPGQGMPNPDISSGGDQGPMIINNGNTSTRTFQGTSNLTFLRFIQRGSLFLNISLLVLGLAAAVGVWLGKKWGTISAFIISLLMLLLALPNLLMRFSLTNWLTVTEVVVRIILAIAVMVLLLLPASRKQGTQARERVVV